MYRLRGGLTTYDVGLAADERGALSRPSLHDVEELRYRLQSLAGDPENASSMRRLVEAGNLSGHVRGDADIVEEFLNLLVRGVLYCRETSGDRYPLVDPTAPLVPLRDLTPEPLDEPRRTWIRVVVEHELGVSTAGMELRYSLDGEDEQYARLNQGGIWHSSGLVGHRCKIHLLDHDALQHRRRLVRRGNRVVSRHSTKDCLTYMPGEDASFALKTGEAHKILILTPRPIYCPSV